MSSLFFLANHYSYIDKNKKIMIQANDKRCVGRNLLKSRRDAKILALELLSGESDAIIDALERGVSVESDRDYDLLSQELDKLCNNLSTRAVKLKTKINYENI